MPNRRARRTAAQAARRGLVKCDVAHCDNFCRRCLSACGHWLCKGCVFGSMRANDFDDHQPHFAFKCPLCRRQYRTAANEVKFLMAEFEPTHRKEMSCCCPGGCGKSYWITHRPCDKGCYDCAESSLELEQAAPSEEGDWETEPSDWETEPSGGDGAGYQETDDGATSAEQEEAALKSHPAIGTTHEQCVAELKLDEMD